MTATTRFHGFRRKNLLKGRLRNPFKISFTNVFTVYVHCVVDIGVESVASRHQSDSSVKVFPLMLSCMFALIKDEMDCTFSF